MPINRFFTAAFTYGPFPVPAGLNAGTLNDFTCYLRIANQGNIHDAAPILGQMSAGDPTPAVFVETTMKIENYLNGGVASLAAIIAAYTVDMWCVGGGGGSAPSNPDGSTQFNDNGVFGGSVAPIHAKAFATSFPPDRQSIQDAIDAAPTGAIVQLDCIEYTLDGVSLSIDKALTFQGCGGGGTVLVGAAATLLNVTGSNVTVQDITFTGSTVGIAVGLSADNRFLRVATETDTGIAMSGATIATIDDCRFRNYSVAGVSIENLVNSDQGDNIISNSTFSAREISGSTYSIRWVSGSGLRVQNNKFLGFVDEIISLAFSNGSGALAGDIMIGPNNSIEVGRATGYGVRIRNTGVGYNGVTVQGNQFTTLAYRFPISIESSSMFGVQNIQVSDNVIQQSATANSILINLDHVLGFNVSNNNLNGRGDTTGVQIDATSGGGLVSDNLYSGLGTNVNDLSGNQITILDDSRGAFLVTGGGNVRYTMGGNYSIDILGIFDINTNFRYTPSVFNFVAYDGGTSVTGGDVRATGVISSALVTLDGSTNPVTFTDVLGSSDVTIENNASKVFVASSQTVSVDTSVAVGVIGAINAGVTGSLTALVLGGNGGSVTGATNAVSINGGVVTTSNTTVVGGLEFDVANASVPSNGLIVNIDDSAPTTEGMFFVIGSTVGLSAAVSTGVTANFNTATLALDSNGFIVSVVTPAAATLSLGTATIDGLTTVNDLTLGTAGTLALSAATQVSVSMSASHQATTNIKFFEEETTILAAAFTDTAAQFPAGSTSLGCTAYVTTVIPGPATVFDLGVAGATTRYATGIAVAATSSGGSAIFAPYASPTSVRLTPDAIPGAATGKVRVTCQYMDVTPATS